MNEQNGREPNGYRWECYKVDRHLDPYMGVVVNPLGYTYTGLFATMAKARSWTRKVMEKDRREPRQPVVA